jgi:hypothetical protein
VIPSTVLISIVFRASHFQLVDCLCAFDLIRQHT